MLTIVIALLSKPVSLFYGQVTNLIGQLLGTGRPPM